MSSFIHTAMFTEAEMKHCMQNEITANL